MPERIGRSDQRVALLQRQAGSQDEIVDKTLDVPLSRAGTRWHSRCPVALGDGQLVPVTPLEFQKDVARRFQNCLVVCQG